MECGTSTAARATDGSATSAALAASADEIRTANADDGTMGLLLGTW
jgi:hypothetical protein